LFWESVAIKHGFDLHPGDRAEFCSTMIQILRECVRAQVQPVWANCKLKIAVLR
jgi:hypothetical protein